MVKKRIRRIFGFTPHRLAQQLEPKATYVVIWRWTAWGLFDSWMHPSR